MPEIGILRDFVSSLVVGVPKVAGDLSLVPLLVGWPGVDADLLEEALARGSTTVTEVDEQGRVGTVRVKHGGPRLLLLVDGEQVVGAKQNRVLNASFLIPPGAAVDLPVSCVERGRWGYRSPGFQASEMTLAGSARAAKLRRVTRSVQAGGAYDADQGAVWRDVDAYLESTRVSSPTSAYLDAYASRAPEIERVSATLVPEPGQVGIAAVRGSTLVGIDLFGSPSLFARGWSKIVRGLLAEVSGGAGAPVDVAGIVRRCLAALAVAPIDLREAPGCGVTLHGSSGGFTVGGVARGADLYHLLVVAA
jgi:hypothetical protein